VPDTCRLTELETVGNDSCSIPEEEEEEEPFLLAPDIDEYLYTILPLRGVG
jgi:hypothetical protein